MKEKVEKTQNKIELQIKDMIKDNNKNEEIQEEVNVYTEIEALSKYYKVIKNMNYLKKNKAQILFHNQQKMYKIKLDIFQMLINIKRFQNRNNIQKLICIKVQFVQILSTQINEQNDLEIIMSRRTQKVSMKYIQEIPQNFTTLEDTDENWTKFKLKYKQMIQQYSKDRESNFNQAIDFIKKLRDNYQEILTKIINDQEDIKIVTEKQYHLFIQIRKIFINQVKINQKTLETLSYKHLQLTLAQQEMQFIIINNLKKYNLIQKEQIIMIENKNNNFLILNEDEKLHISNCDEIEQFLENTSFLQSYMTIFEDSIQQDQNLQKQIYSLNVKVKYFNQCINNKYKKRVEKNWSR
ncbi:unnamed protein product [Paramecium pentaurelia]|uniref:Uncharacterized protein n=1 Tax=Paramecium pentaurelia TaxID=43138 RepID=A0A8S1YLZ3_9CILI|nr:unnamed protein product [Paramecium pentaurelia]